MEESMVMDGAVETTHTRADEIVLHVRSQIAVPPL